MSKDWISDLRKIGELRDLGLLTEEEFHSEKTRILSTRVNPTVSQKSTQVTPEEQDDEAWETLAGGVSENEIFDVSPYEFSEDERIGSYKILGELGIGGMGVVYRARHLEETWALQQGGDVALKIMRGKFAKDTQFRTRFIREAAVGRSIEHTNVARVHEVLVEGGRLGLVMDLVEGGSMTSLVEKGAVPFKKVIQLISPLCDALDYLHARGIIHRDLKPENIKITEDGKPVILDFGIAKMDNSEEMTKTGVLMGTVSYMAPEQIDAKTVGPAADRYALGVIVYEMLAGRRPWEKGTSEGRIYTLKLQGVLNPLHHVKSDVPMRVSKAVMKMLSTRVEDRYSSCEAFLNDLLDRKMVASVKTQSQEKETSTSVAVALSEEDLKAAREEYATLSASIEELKVDRAAQERKINSLQRMRDEAIQKVESTMQKIRENAEEELESLITSQESKANKAETAFTEKREELESVIQELRAQKSKAQSQYKSAKEELASGWNSFVSIFSSQKKAELQKKVAKTKQRLDDLTSKLSKAQENLENQLSKIEEQSTKDLGKAIKEREERVEAAQNKRDKKLAIANTHLNAAKDKAQAKFQKAKKKVEETLRSVEDQIREKNRQIQKIKASFPQEVWLIKTSVEVGTTEMEMVQVPAAQFWMGQSLMNEQADEDESPRHLATITRAFWMSTMLVNQQLYETIMQANPSKKRSISRPVESVSWYQAVEFCNRLSEACGFLPVYQFDSANAKNVTMDLNADGFRLPTEAEWEYAAGAEQGFPYAGSDDVNQVCWYSSNSGYTTKPVGRAKHNGFGLYDMSGNVWEWCWDWYGEYSTMEQVDPVGKEKGRDRVRRGGSFRNKAVHCRVTNRASSEPSSASSATGFRVVRSIV